MIITSIIILSVYAFLIIALIIGFDRISEFESRIHPDRYSERDARNEFSIIIPFRNEAKNLPSLLESISLLNYPEKLFEIIFIDDSSEDNSVKIIEEFIIDSQIDIKLINNDRKTVSPKKDAIEMAIDQAKFEWIVTTDADCILPKRWLQIFDAYIQEHQPLLIAAPVTYKTNKSILEQFQFFDFLSLQASTVGGFGIGKPFLCNGANLCYEKYAFYDVGGFDGNTHIASGDDTFLLEKIWRWAPDKVHFLKSDEAIVSTNPQVELKQLISQRIRWASKTMAITNNFTKLIGVIVFLVNLLFVVMSILSLLNLFLWQTLFLLFFIKTILDFVLLKKTAHAYNQYFSILHYLRSSLFYPFFIVFIAFSSLKTGHHWKGRQFKK